MVDETGRCEVSFMSTAIFELMHRLTRRLADGHTSGMGQLQGQPQMMEMLLRSATIIATAQVEFPALFDKLVRKAKRRALKYRPDRRAARSCLHAAVTASKRCCDEGKATTITDTRSGCAVSLTDEPCPAQHMCKWKTGATACAGYDEATYPPAASPWCTADARRKGGPRETLTSDEEQAQAAFAAAEAASQHPGVTEPDPDEDSDVEPEREPAADRLDIEEAIANADSAGVSAEERQELQEILQEMIDDDSWLDDDDGNEDLF
eukprot:COSAG02_NODE_273_length_26316_cov_13.661060_19_plen_264_part_00